MHKPDLRALQRHTEGTDDVLGRDASMSGFCPINGEHIFHLIGFDVIIHIHDANGGLEELPDLASDCYLANVIGTIHFRDENGLYRWAWRDLNDFHVSSVLPCNLLDGRPQ